MCWMKWRAISDKPYLAYASGFLNAIVSAPCPPMLCPVMDMSPFF